MADTAGLPALDRGASPVSHQEAAPPLLQLVAVATLPEFQALQPGNALRLFALQVARLRKAPAVVALTRCSSFEPSGQSIFFSKHDKNLPL